MSARTKFSSTTLEREEDQDLPRDQTDGKKQSKNLKRIVLLEEKLPGRTESTMKVTGQEIDTLGEEERAIVKSSVTHSKSELEKKLHTLKNEKKLLEEEKERLENNIELGKNIEKEKAYTLIAEYEGDALKTLLFLNSKEKTVSFQRLNEAVDTENLLCEVIANMCKRGVLEFEDSHVALTDRGKELINNLQQSQ